ncbi:MAG: site-specific integrase [Hyphomicrobiaceae bacterium]|nr:site-specific integrase [Hyphomicrobiaceae bacterium]
MTGSLGFGGNVMGRNATNTLVFNDLAVRKVIKDSEGKPRREWRIEKVLSGKGDAERRTPMPGFILITQPTGGGTFYYFYRNALGVLKKARLGEYAEVGLDGAKRLWESKTTEVRGGADPVGDRHALRSAMTFKELAEAFLSKGNLAAQTKANYARHLNAHIYAVIGDKPAETVNDSDVLAICRKLEAKDNYALSNVVKSIIGGAYKYGRKQGLSSAAPCLGIGRRGQKVARDRNPTDKEISALWKAIDASEAKTTVAGEKMPKTAKLSQAMRLIIKIAIVTGQRRTEVAGVQRSELVGLEGKDPKWIIPGDMNKRGKIIEGRTKNGREQIVPLSSLAAALFKEALECCADGKHVFPADLDKVKLGKQPREPHIHGESVSRAMRRLREDAGVEDVSIHDMRRAISNWLKDQGVSREVRDLVLNHTDSSVTEAHYSQGARMLTQVKAALEAWAAHVNALVEGSEAGSNVVRLGARA